MTIQGINSISIKKYSNEYFGERILLINAFEFYFFNLIALEDKLKNILTHCLSNIISSKSEIKRTLPDVWKSQSSMCRTKFSTCRTTPFFGKSQSSMCRTVSSMCRTKSSMCGMEFSTCRTVPFFGKSRSSMCRTGFSTCRI